MEVKVYPHEIQDGISEQIKQNSIAYCTQLSQAERPSSVATSNLTIAGCMDDDLHYIQAIMVSTNWNKNDDIFKPDEVWRARGTPEDKPMNLDHDEHKLVGHIISRYAMNADGEPIPDETEIDNLPDFYHLVTGSVLYKKWVDEALMERTAALLQKINAGEKFVSMECVFNNFDYGILVDGACQVVKRNEATAYLTKHLRAYGGLGTYKSYRIGRVLRDINFTGKGIVDHPANPDSIIFRHEDLKSLASIKVFEQKSETNCVISNSTTLTSKVKKPMDEKKLQEINDKLDAALADNKLLRDELAKAGTESLKKQYDELAQKFTTLEAANADLQSKLDSATKASADLQTSLNESVKQVQEIGEAKAALEAQLATIEAEKVVASRKAQLISKGFKDEDADASVKKLANLSKEQFETVVAFISVPKAPEDKPSTDTKIIDTAVAGEQPALAAAADDAAKVKFEKVRADFAAWAGSVLGTPQKTDE